MISRCSVALPASEEGFSVSCRGFPGQDRGKNVRLAVHHVGIGVAALGDQPDVFGYVGVSRAGPLAVHYLMKVVGIAFAAGRAGWINEM